MTSNADRVAADLLALAATTNGDVHRAVTNFTAELERTVKRNASGRPGPNAPTGNYRRSINRQVQRLPPGTTGQVGTSAPQGRRLEYGFHGVDSLGRTYRQPAYPHFGPALDDIGPKFLAAMNLIGVPASTRGTTRGIA